MSLIAISNLEKSFDMGSVSTHALRGVDLVIEEGDFLAIVGPSGSGKSTLLQIIGLLDPLSAGTYFLSGKDTAKLSEEEIAELRNTTMGFIFQSFNLLARTSVLENVKLPFAYSRVPARVWDMRATKQIYAVGRAHRTHHEPSQLPGGDRPRVAVARALVNDPQIIFADEPTGNLDSVSGKAVMDLLEKLHHDGKTVVLITHDKSLAKRAHRAILMRDGLIHWQGPASEIPELS